MQITLKKENKVTSQTVSIEEKEIALRRRLLNLVPHAGVQQIRRIADEIDEYSRHIFEEKKRAMREGDAAVVHQIGEGKDIMSKLSACVQSGARWIGGADARCSAGEHACE